MLTRSIYPLLLTTLIIPFSAAIASADPLILQGVDLNTDTSLTSPDSIAHLGFPGSSPFVEHSHETVEYKDPEDQTTRYRPGNNKTTRISINGYTLEHFASPDEVANFPAQSFFDISTAISSDTISDPFIIRRQDFKGLGVNGRDGFSLDLDYIIPGQTDDILINITCTLPPGQGLSFSSVKPVFTPTVNGSYLSTFDVSFELDLPPGTSYDSSRAMFDLTTTITPEPSTLLLLTLTGPLVLRRRK